MTSLEKATASATPVEGVHFDSDNLEEFDFGEVEFRNCRFSNCRFDYATLNSVRFFGCMFDYCSFKETIFANCLFMEGEMGTQWRYSDISKAEFRKCNLGLNRFVGCDAYLTEFKECAGQGMKLDLNCQRKIRTQVIPGGVRFLRCKMQYTEFSPGDYQESVFESCDLRDCSFAGTRLNSASFRGSSLNNADFSGAVLDHADLAHASFDELDFGSMASFRALAVTRDQHEAIATSFGLLTVD